MMKSIQVKCELQCLLLMLSEKKCQALVLRSNNKQRTKPHLSLIFYIGCFSLERKIWQNWSMKMADTSRITIFA